MSSPLRALVALPVDVRPVFLFVVTAPAPVPEAESRAAQPRGLGCFGSELALVKVINRDPRQLGEPLDLGKEEEADVPFPRFGVLDSERDPQAVSRSRQFARLEREEGARICLQRLVDVRADIESLGINVEICSSSATGDYYISTQFVICND